MKQKRYYLYLIIICSLFSIAHPGFAEDLTSIHQTNLNLVERLARLEEAQKAIVVEMRTGQKSIIVEMRTRFEAVDKRFDTIDKRFDTIDKRFDTIDKRFETIDKRFDTIDKRFDTIDKRFDSLIREMSHRFDGMDKRISLLENQISNLGAYIFSMFAAIIALLAYVIWDRKTAFDKAFSESLKNIEQMFQLHIEKFHPVEPFVQQEGTFNEKSKLPAEHQNNESFSIPENIQNKFRDVVNFMNQFPEMRPIMNSVA